MNPTFVIVVNLLFYSLIIGVLGLLQIWLSGKRHWFWGMIMPATAAVIGIIRFYPLIITLFSPSSRMNEVLKAHSSVIFWHFILFIVPLSVFIVCRFRRAERIKSGQQTAKDARQKWHPWRSFKRKWAQMKIWKK